MPVVMAVMRARQRRVIGADPATLLAPRLVESRTDSATGHQADLDSAARGLVMLLVMAVMLAMMLRPAAVLLLGPVLVMGFREHVGIARHDLMSPAAVLAMMLVVMAMVTGMAAMLHVMLVVLQRTAGSLVMLAVVLVVALVMALVMLHDGGS